MRSKSSTVAARTRRRQGEHVGAGELVERVDVAGVGELQQPLVGPQRSGRPSRGVAERLGIGARPAAGPRHDVVDQRCGGGRITPEQRGVARVVGQVSVVPGASVPRAARVTS